jgi:outer membrane protein assembly factor BamB
MTNTITNPTRPRRARLRLCLRMVESAALAVAFSGEISRAQDATFQGNAARTGRVEMIALAQPPAVLWKFRPESSGGSIPDLGGILAAGDQLYCSDRSGRIYSLGAADGVRRWTYEIGKTGWSKAPLVMGDIAYFATSVGVLALSTGDGTLVWHFDIPLGADETSPLMVDDTVLVCGYDGNVYSLDAQTGELGWSTDIVADAPPSPPGFDGQRARLTNKPAKPMIAASDGKTLFQPVFDQSRLVALDCATGGVRWSFQAKGWIYAHPVVDNNRVFIGSQDKNFYCLDKDSGQVLWTFTTKWRVGAGAAVHDDAIYFGSHDGAFYRLAAKTGKMVWSFQSDADSTGRSFIGAAPLIADGVAYFAGTEGQVYALTTADGALRWKFRPSENSHIDSDLATDGQRLFLTTRPNGDKNGESAIIAIGEKKATEGR